MSYWGIAVWGSGYWGPAYPGACWVAIQQLAAVSTKAVQLAAVATEAVQLSRVEVVAVSIEVLQRNVIQITARFKKLGVYTNPSSAILRLKKPDGTELGVPPTLTQVSTGIWRAEFDTAGQPAGVWTYHVEGDGLVDCADQGTFTITASGFA